MTQRVRDASRACLLLLLLAAVWLLAPPAGVPLYDGVGFPDEPYRFVPAQGQLPPATAAETSIDLTGGVNQGGKVANSAERGPQVSVFAPPQAFQVAAATATAQLVIRAEAVPPVSPPPGRLQSNVYRLSLTSPAGPVTVNPRAQPIGMALRAATLDESQLPVMQYRPDEGAPWQVLKTARAGQDVFTGAGPGAGDYVLTPPVAPVAGRTSRTLLAVLVGVALVFVLGALIAVRRLNRASGQAPNSSPNPPTV